MPVANATVRLHLRSRRVNRDLRLFEPDFTQKAGQNRQMSPPGSNRSLPSLFRRIANYCHERHLIAQAMLEAAKFFKHRARFA
jgi:hypothetical protein